MKEFGKIIKSSFILKYYEDLNFRQSIEKMLSHIELMNRFAKAVFFSNNQEFQSDRRCGCHKRGARKDYPMQIIAAKCDCFVELYVLIGNAHKSIVSGRIGGDNSGH